LDARLAGEHGGEFLTTPLRMAGAVLEGVVVDKPIEVVCQRTGHFGWATGAGAIHQALDPLVGEAMDPLAQRGIGKVQRVGHRLEAVPLDDLAYGLGTAEDAGLLGLLKEGIQGGESLLGKVEFEGPHSGGLQEKLLQKFTQVHSSWVLLSEQNLFDSNFSGAAYHLEFGPKTGAACLAHIVDFCWGIDPVSEKKAKNIKGLHTARIFPATYWGLWLNFRVKPFDDVRVRRAINLVLDKAALVDAVSDSVGSVRAGWLLPPDSFFQEYWNKVREQPGWRSPTAEDRAEARRLMQEAGYENGIKGLDFMVRDIPFQLAWAPIVQDMLKRELKIESTIRPVASGVWWEEASRGHYDITIYAYGVTIPHVADYWANSFKTDGGYNFSFYANPEWLILDSRVVDVRIVYTDAIPCPKP